jgi:hypothetical protein
MRLSGAVERLQKMHSWRHVSKKKPEETQHFEPFLEYMNIK